MRTAPIESLARPGGNVTGMTVGDALPTMYFAREQVTAGGLMGYGANLDYLNRRAAASADKILRGANLAVLPVEQPTTFEFVVNLTTATELGLTVPASAQTQVTEWVQ